MHFGKIRIERNRLGELVASAGIILNIHFCGSQHQVRFRRVAIAQNPVDQKLPLFHALLVDQCRSQQVGNRQIVGILLLRRLENANHIVVAAHAQIAVRQQQHRLVVCWDLPR